ncbi:hypothetical protein DITRI_Ditri05aG0069700 [Diplodiscus trichospermus]
MYKSKLQELCQKRRWALPRYTSLKDGPDHNPCFKASVFLNGMSFHSSTSLKSCKEAENEAAKSAFLYFVSSFSSPAATQNPVQEVDFGLYKNLLQELTQREELSTPEYRTMKCGLPHRPTFFSSVEVEGEVFYGKGGASKKEAEINAAKFAFTNLSERLQVRSHELCSPQYLAGEKVLANSTTRTSPDGNPASCSKSVHISPKEGLFSCTNVVNDEPLKSMSSSDMSTALENEEHVEENELQEMKAEAEVLANATTSPDIHSSCSKSEPVSLKEASLSSTPTQLDISALTISDSESPGLRSYLLNNRFRVYPCFPDIAFPKGITVMPISEDKWVAVSLEFPNERAD